MDEMIRATIQSNLSLLKFLIMLIGGYIIFVFLCLNSFYNTRQNLVFEIREKEIDEKTKKYLNSLEKIEKVLLILSKNVAIPMLIVLSSFVIANYLKL
ncbi:MAG: hypothetical protein ACRC1R_00755 [Cetobacterium sp.]|uniref:hypothetical protein n=1 Tax=Cetobacterium sp. TaxID=2071632 RepID=UPI003F40D158